jgi:hypothetical protein
LSTYAYIHSQHTYTHTQVWRASHLNILKLRMIAPEIFPLPPHLRPANPGASTKSPAVFPGIPEIRGLKPGGLDVNPGAHLAKFWLFPAKRVGAWDKSGCVGVPGEADVKV